MPGQTKKPGYGASIGDQVWLDANADGIYDGAEVRVPGVTVALIRDANADGIWDPDGADDSPGTADDEPIVATDVTDAYGSYQFDGVPVTDGVGTDDYLVWVNDTNNVLAGLTQTYDSNGLATPNVSAATDLTPAGNLLQDFSYTPAGQEPNEGVIGDTIWLNLNGNHRAGAG